MGRSTQAGRGRARRPIDILEPMAVVERDASGAAAQDGAQSFGQRPGLDAVRGIAVAVILVVHSWPERAAAGILSVDVFFTLSGFLITTLILVEAQSSGTLALRSFWSRRARRLVPALIVVTAAVVALATLGAYGNTTVSRDAFAAFTWSSNWVQVGGDYFAGVGAQSPLEHFWTLAIEEQFYVVLPLSMAALSWRTGRLRTALGALAFVGAVFCIWRAAALSAQGASVNRLYMGTDTRAVALFVGVGVASVMFGRWQLGRTASRAVTGAAVALVTGWAVAALAGWAPTVSGLAEGGWALASLGAAVLVVAACQEPVGRAFSRVHPVMWLGTRSYGLYLWHLPILLLLGRSNSGAHEVVALVACGVLAEVSHRFVERPVRQGRSTWWSHTGFATLAAGVVVAALVVPTGPPSTAERLAVESANHTDVPPTVPAGPTATVQGTAVTAPPPVPVFVWGDDIAPLVAAQLGNDARLAVTVEAHPECRDPGRCRSLTPSVTGVGMVVIAVRGPEPFGSRITRPMDPTEPERLAQEVWNRWSSAAGTVPVALVTPPDERLDLGPVLHLRNRVGSSPANLVLGTEPAAWAQDVASRVAGTAQRKLLLVGDSVAWSLAASFSPAGFVVWDRTQLGCNTAAGDLVSVRGGRDRSGAVCDWRTVWAGEVAAFDPDVVVVHVGTWESYDRWLGDAVAPAGSVPWAAAQQAQFGGVFDVFGSLGAKVALVVEAPAWETAAGKPVETRPEESARRMAAVLAVAREAAAGREGVTVLDAADAVCAERGCDRPDLRDDGVHYTPGGARTVASWLTPQLAALG